MGINTRKIIKALEDGKSGVHRAGWIIVDPDTIFRDACIEVHNGVITHVGKKRWEKTDIDHGPGVLMPPLVNAHLHLELSALKNQLSFYQGFRAWVKQLLEKRQALSIKEMKQAAKIQAEYLNQAGTFWIGDIAGLDIIKPMAGTLPLNGIFFQEFLGTQVPEILPEKKNLQTFSLAGHAPHTTSPDVLKILKERTRSGGNVFSIHLAESDDESEFIRDRKGAWADFLISRGIDFSTWQIIGKTPVAYASHLGLLDRRTLAVHLLNVTLDDIRLLARSQAKVCLCPRSNENLHGRLPDIDSMIRHGIAPALGTDSLASCDSLDVVDEMAFVQKKYPALDPYQIFAMGTVNGARALGIQHLTGTIEKGKRADFVYNPVTAHNKNTLLEKIISNEN